MNPTKSEFMYETGSETTQRQTVVFETREEPDEFNSTYSIQIEKHFQESNKVFVDGLRILTRTADIYVSSVAKNLLDNLDDHQAIANILQKEVHSKSTALDSFSAEINKFYNCGDFYVEQSAIAVLMALFPSHPQPYACFATLLWRRDGIDSAKEYYEYIVQVFQDPVLDYFAGQCLMHTDRIKLAEQLLNRAKNRALAKEGFYSELLPMIETALQFCHRAIS